MLIFVALCLFFSPILIIAYFLPTKAQDYIAHFILVFSANFWCVVGCIFPRIYYRNKIDFKKSYVVVANHQSYFDPVQMYTALPYFFKSVGKVEIKKVPIFGMLYKMAVIVVDRSSVSKSATTYRQMVRYLRNNWSILIFPEGTFSIPEQPQLLAFKKWAFTLVQKEQKAVLPMLFVDTAQRMPPGKLFEFTPGYLTTVFLPPIPFDKFEQEADLRKFTQEYMQACMDYCRDKDYESVWDFAEEYLKEQIL